MLYPSTLIKYGEHRVYKEYTIPRNVEWILGGILKKLHSSNLVWGTYH